MRPDLFDAVAWEYFLRELAAIRKEELVDEVLLERLQQAWAPPFKGRDEATCRDIYSEVMDVLLRERIVPPDWSALR